jgi:hypothetical protein
MLGLPALVAGLILLLAGGSWFTGAATVGWILIGIGGIVVLFSLVVFLTVATAIAKPPPAGPRRRR